MAIPLSNRIGSMATANGLYAVDNTNRGQKLLLPSGLAVTQTSRWHTTI